VPVRPATRLWACWFGEKESSAAASTTRWRVAAATWSRPLSAFEAVAIETPASSATSLRVAALPIGVDSVRATVSSLAKTLAVRSY
jgi:hypothetical protein